MMIVSAVGARAFPTRDPVMEMAPMGGATSLGSTPSTSIASIVFRTRWTLGQPASRSRISPPGRTPGTVEIGVPGLAARRMSIQEAIVPWSFAAQRTKAKILPGENETMRRRRSMMRSWVIWPNRIQRSTRPFCQSSSTLVRSSICFISLRSRESACAQDCAASADYQTALERGPLDVAVHFCRDAVVARAANSSAFAALSKAQCSGSKLGPRDRSGVMQIRICVRTPSLCDRDFGSSRNHLPVLRDRLSGASRGIDRCTQNSRRPRTCRRNRTALARCIGP